MAQLVNTANKRQYQPLLSSMFRDRKRVFVDYLGWDLPTSDGEEQDGFDAFGAEYLILCAPGGQDHLGSLRLLRTDRPHILDTMFADLCEGEVPRGPNIREISRLCLSPRCGRDQVADYRAHLATALVEYALLTEIDAYTAVIDASNLTPLLARGWHCQPMGLPRIHARQNLLAVRLDITPQTIALLRRAGNYRENALQCALDVELVAA